jgi:hypothetical protein
MWVPPKYKAIARRVEEHIAMLNPPQGPVITTRRIFISPPSRTPEPEPAPPRGVEPRAPGTSNIGSGYR